MLAGAVFSICVTATHGDPVPGAQKWAAETGERGVSNFLWRAGVRAQAERDAITMTWDEDTLLDALIAGKGYNALQGPFDPLKLSRAGRDRVKAALISEDPLPRDLIKAACRFPATERAEFEDAAYASVPQAYPGREEYGKMVVKYQLLANTQVYHPSVDEADVLKVLLTAEPLPMASARLFKKALHDRAIILARSKLRADGKSFVTKGGVNPLVPLIQRVVDALNAPMCSGLEAALRELGSDVQDVDRTALSAAATEWQDRLIQGLDTVGSAHVYIGKLSVALGPEGFNRFVDEYNNGTGGGN